MKHFTQFFALLAVLLLSSAAFAASPVAYVYAQTPSGSIYEYAASSKGELTAIEYSPDTNTQGVMVGSNKSYFITVDSQVLHAYTIAPGGRIASQSWTMDTQNYAGSECGAVSGAVLDHTGRYVYVLLSGGIGPHGTPCAVYQTYEIGFGGSLAFVGVTEDVSHGGFPAETPLKIEGNSKYAFEAPAGANYASPGSGCNPYMNLLSRESSGALNYIDAGTEVSGPASGPDESELLPVPWLITDDLTDHLAVAVFDTEGTGDQCGIGGPIQLASFTVNSHGNLTSTNSGGNMPTVPGGASSIVLNKTGEVLAVATGPGVEFFHFNGAKPITEFTGILGTSGYISEMSWDISNHLYAVNGSSGRLHLYDVTSTGAKEAAGSPYLPPGGATSLVVVSN